MSGLAEQDAPTAILAVSTSPPANNALLHLQSPVIEAVANENDATSATVEILAASNALQTDPPSWIRERMKTLVVPIRAVPITIANASLPDAVRRDWTTMYATVHAKYHTYPFYVCFSIPTICILVIITELEDPDFFPRLYNLTSGIIGFLFASVIVLGGIVLLDFGERGKWPWQEEGWVWPWEKWLWQETAYDLGASTSSEVPPTPFPAPTANTVRFDTPASTSTQTPTHGSSPALAADTSTPTPTPEPQPQPLIIPPTPFLPPGLRPIHLQPPQQLHPSGLMGASPEPSRFKRFSGTSFQAHENNMRAIKQWSKPQGGRLVDIQEQIIGEKRDRDGDELILKRRGVVRQREGYEFVYEGERGGQDAMGEGSGLEEGESETF